MPTRRRLIIAGLLTLLAGLVILFPARVAYNWFSPPGIALGGINGTLWLGSARHMTAEGIYFGKLRWRMKPLRLLAGKLAYRIEASPVSGFIESELAIGFSGDLFLTDLTASLQLDVLQQATGIRGIRGDASVRFEQLRLSNGLPVSARGTLDVSGLLLPLVALTPIGGYHAEFFTQPDGVVASIEDTDGVVDLAGSLKISSDRNYQFLGQLAAKPETPQQIVQQMRFLGSPNERGQYELRLEGQL